MISRALTSLTVDAIAGGAGASGTAGAGGVVFAALVALVAPVAVVALVAPASGAGGGTTKRWNKNSTRNERVIARRTLRSICELVIFLSGVWNRVVAVATE